ncbi:MAG: hypothetical protein IT210_09730 [Armatimonadetes bacterium]|nr:hypothetical protein [Armatimonadota bacterium]
MPEKSEKDREQEASVLSKGDRPPLVMVQYGKIEDMDRSFGIAFWQAQDATARF